MENELQPLLDFLEQQKARQASHFPSVAVDEVLSFMGTTSLPGTRAGMTVQPLLGIERAAEREGLDVRLGGALPRLPVRGECITVHLTNLAAYQGYQVKTRALASGESPARLCQSVGPEVLVRGAQVFTVHHSPYTMTFFEHVPFEEVQEMVGRTRYALVGVGETANISPRFVFHFEARHGRVALYHGDGLALKTYMNLRSNRQETRLVLDLDDFSGYELRGTVEEFQPHQHPEAYHRICQGFTAGGWGKPTRTFRLVADAWRPIAPAAPAPE